MNNKNLAITIVIASSFIFVTGVTWVSFNAEPEPEYLFQGILMTEYDFEFLSEKNFECLGNGGIFEVVDQGNDSDPDTRFYYGCESPTEPEIEIEWQFDFPVSPGKSQEQIDLERDEKRIKYFIEEYDYKFINGNCEPDFHRCSDIELKLLKPYLDIELFNFGVLVLPKPLGHEEKIEEKLDTLIELLEFHNALHTGEYIGSLEFTPSYPNTDSVDTTITNDSEMPDECYYVKKHLPEPNEWMIFYELVGCELKDGEYEVLEK